MPQSGRLSPDAIVGSRPIFRQSGHGNSDGRSGTVNGHSPVVPPNCRPHRCCIVDASCARAQADINASDSVAPRLRKVAARTASTPGSKSARRPSRKSPARDRYGTIASSAPFIVSGIAPCLAGSTALGDSGPTVQRRTCSPLRRSKETSSPW